MIPDSKYSEAVDWRTLLANDDEWIEATVKKAADAFRAVLSDIPAAPKHGEWKMVPVEPTDIQAEAGAEEVDTYNPSDEYISPRTCKEIYRAMLAAAPIREPGAEELLDRAARLADQRALQDEQDNGSAKTGAADGLGDLIRALRTKAPATGEGEGEKK